MLKVFRGTVLDFSQCQERRTGYAQQGTLRVPTVYYQTITNFKMDDQQIKLVTGHPPRLAGGDDIVVSGFKIFGELKVLAFKNFSQQKRWGNNIIEIMPALFLIILSLILDPETLLQLHIIDMQTYLDLMREVASRFSIWKSLMEFLPAIRLVLGLLGTFFLIVGLPKLIAYMRIKDA